MNYLGTAEPIAVEEIWETPCVRCGAHSQCQWAICANNGNHLPLCIDCDIALNRLILMFLNVEPDDFIADYREKLISKGLMDGCAGENSTGH
jgi:NAD-dependent SIR2 family protein deacetylase